MPQLEPTDSEQIRAELDRQSQKIAELASTVKQVKSECEIKLSQQDNLHAAELQRLKSSIGANRQELRANSMGTLVFTGTFAVVMLLGALSIKWDDSGFSYNPESSLKILTNATTIAAVGGALTAAGALFGQKKPPE